MEDYASRETELMPSLPPKKKEKKKFVPKEPVLIGPFFGGGDQVIPQLLQSSTVQFLGDFSMNPFSNYEAVFIDLESSSGSKKSTYSVSEAANNTFPESLLPSMIQVTSCHINITIALIELFRLFRL